MMVEMSSAIESGKSGISIIKYIHAPVVRFLEKKSIYYSPELVKLQKRLFPALSWGISSDVGKAHEKYPHKIHPDNMVAAEEISKSLTTIFRRGRKIEKFYTYKKPDIESHLILIGSPKSTFLTRKAMGYQKESGKLMQEPETDLRFVFDFDEKDLDVCKRKVAGEIHEVANYAIKDRDGIKNFNPPRTDHRDHLTEDYLLLTVMPNNLSVKHTNRDIINPSGVHGVGTRSFSLLLKNKDILEKIDKDRGTHRYYQSIIKITKVEHTEKYYNPAEIEHILTIPHGDVLI